MTTNLVGNGRIVMNLNLDDLVARDPVHWGYTNPLDATYQFSDLSQQNSQNVRCVAIATSSSLQVMALDNSSGTYAFHDVSVGQFATTTNLTSLDPTVRTSPTPTSASRGSTADRGHASRNARSGIRTTRSPTAAWQSGRMGTSDTAWRSAVRMTTPTRASASSGTSSSTSATRRRQPRVRPVSPGGATTSRFGRPWQMRGDSPPSATSPSGSELASSRSPTSCPTGGPERAARLGRLRPAQ